jgi:hypothetical protein
MPYGLMGWVGVSLGFEVAMERGTFVAAGGTVAVASSVGVTGTPHAERVITIVVIISKCFFTFIISYIYPKVTTWDKYDFTV